MAIIKFSDALNNNHYINELTDQFVSTKEKQTHKWIKSTIDFFAYKAHIQYNENISSFVKNYQLIKGILTPADFYEEDQVKSYTEMMLGATELPNYVQSYSTMSIPINQLVGEISKRPDQYRTKAFDDDSKSEELDFRTDLIKKYILQEAEKRLRAKALLNGEEINEEEIQQLTLKSVQEDIDNYTSIAEKFTNKILECQKLDFSMKEKGEDAFRDLCIAAQEYFLIYEDNSKVGFNVITVNPKNKWSLSTSDKKYTSDVTGRMQGAYAAGTIEIMELSEIIEGFPDLTKEEIDYLRQTANNFETTIDSQLTGPNSIKFNTYSRLLEQEKEFLNSEIELNNNAIFNFSNNSESRAVNYGLKFPVIRCYWASKRKIGRVVYIDELNTQQSIFVDDTYKSKDMLTEISLDWGYITEWYQGNKIGSDIYHVKPFKLFNYCPLIGTMYENKNTKAKSLVDLMKPFATIIDLCMNQLWDLLKKEKGRVQLMSLRHIPIPKDSDAQDAIDIWETEARERGVIFVDDSPENLKSPSSFNQYTVLDLTKTQEIQSRYTLVQQMKQELNNICGMTPQRLGSVTASESATGTNAAISQSYSQTEPLFVAHEYVIGQVYQAIVDASLYLASNIKETTISFISSEGDSQFLKVKGEDLKLRDIKVFLTNRKEDVDTMTKVQELSQAIIQNGGSVSDIIELYTTKSLRDIKKTFKNLKERQEAQQQQAQQLEQDKLAQVKQAQEVQLAQVKLTEEQRIVNDNYQADLERINKKEVAAIRAFQNNENALADTNNDGMADSLALANIDIERNKATTTYNLKLQEIQAKMLDSNNKKQIESEKRQVERENMQNDLQIAKTNAVNRNKNK